MPPRFGYKKYSKGRLTLIGHLHQQHTHILYTLCKFYNLSVRKLASLFYVFHIFVFWTSFSDPLFTYCEIICYIHESTKVLVAQLCPTLCSPTDYIACQAPLSMGFSRQEYWSGLPFPNPGKFSKPKGRTWVSCIADKFFTIWATEVLITQLHL